MEVRVYNREKYILKPDIRIRNYYFQWNEYGFGINSNEANHFKNFIRKTIPVLEQYMRLLQNEGKIGIDKNDNFRDKKQICVNEKYNKNISFQMFIDSQGSTLFFREESCEIGIDDGSQSAYGCGIKSKDQSNMNFFNSNHNDNKMGVRWLLGKLLFDRKQQQTKK